MSTQAQIDANRKNAALSTGPKTDEGKKIAAMNSTIHGFCASPNSTLPPAKLNAAEYERKLKEWFEQVDPRDVVEAALVTRACRAFLKLERFALAEDHSLDSKVRDAFDAFDRAQADRAFALGDELKSCKGDPSAILRAMKSFARGAQWLLDRWRELVATLAAGWDVEAKRLVMLMLGRRPDDPSDPAAGTLGALTHETLVYRRLAASDADLLAP